MVSPTSSNYSEPRDWQEFERLCRALLSEVYSVQFQRRGRSGQRQNGVDAYGLKKDNTAIAIQCKGRDGTLGAKLKPRDIDDAVNSIESFPHKIDIFIILTTSSVDVNLQNRAEDLNKSRLPEGKCKVEIWGWGHICDLIGDYPKIQYNYFGYLFRNTSIRQKIILISFLTSFVLLAFIAFRFYDSKYKKYELSKSVSVNDIKQIRLLTDNLENAYINCEGTLSSHIFSFSYQIESSCTNPVRIQLNAIKSKLDDATIDLDSSAWSDINQLTKIMDDDYRQSIMSLDITKGFEDEVIRSLKDFCNHQNPGQEIEKLRQKNIERTGREAMISQLNYYFIVRDFIIPSIESMKSRELIFARELNNESIPDDLLNKAGNLSKIITDRQHYVLDEPSEPFTLSALKAQSSHEIKSKSLLPKELNFVEQARWKDVYLQSLTQAFQGRKNDVEELISCGVLKPKIRELVNKN